MNIKRSSLEQIRFILLHLQQDSDTQRKFIQEVWSSIIQLTKTYPVEEVCHQLQIHQAALG